MRFSSLACALSALVAVSTASPVDVSPAEVALEKRQNLPGIPPYVAQGVKIFSCTFRDRAPCDSSSTKSFSSSQNVTRRS